MKYQKSPFPYVFLLIGILGISIYFNLVIDKKINAPIVHTINANDQEDLPIAKSKEIQLKSQYLLAEK